MLARVCRTTISPQITSLLKTPVLPKVNQLQANRLFASDGRSAFTRSAVRKAEAPTLRERLSAPAGDTAFNLGKGFVAGGAVIGLGALCYYGAGLSSASGAIDHYALWPDYVKERVRTTYMYFGSSIGISAATAAACLRSPAIMRVVSRGGLIGVGVSLAAMIGSSMLAHSLPYEEGFGAKQMAWMLHSGVMGAFLAPLSFLGGSLIISAACYTAGIVGGLSAIAACAPSDKFLYMGGALGIALGGVFAASVGSMFLPPTTVFGSGLHSVALFGGLVLFSLFLLYDTQRIVRDAETHPVALRQWDYEGHKVRSFDPINHAISIYMDTLNIFVRVVQILAMNGGGKRK